QEAAAEKVLPHPFDLLLRKIQELHFAQVRDRKLEHLVVVEVDQVGHTVDVELRHLCHDLHQVLFALRPVVTPRWPVAGADRSPVTEGRHVILDPRECEFVLYDWRVLYACLIRTQTHHQDPKTPRNEKKNSSESLGPWGLGGRSPGSHGWPELSLSRS